MEDGCVLVVGTDQGNTMNVSEWKGIQSVAAGWMSSMGLRQDGTVYKTGLKRHLRDLAWTDVAQLVNGPFGYGAIHRDHTVSLCFELQNEYEMAVMKDMAASLGHVIDLAVGHQIAIGLKEDGKVVFAGMYDTPLASSATAWHDIVAVSAGYIHIAGLQKDGTVVVANDSHHPYYRDLEDAANWTDIVQLSSSKYLAGLKADGTVVVAGTDGSIDTSDLSGIVQIAAAEDFICALDGDGNVHTRGPFMFRDTFGAEGKVVWSR